MMNAILATLEPQAMPNSQEDAYWQAVLDRDASHDGKFVFAVSSTGIYCRPSCPSRRPRRTNVSFYRGPEEAEKAGYRGCLRCRPRTSTGNKEADTMKDICRYIEQHLDEPLTLPSLGAFFHQSPFHLQRTFKAAVGVTPKQYADACRMNRVKSNLRAGQSVTHALYDAGFGSSRSLYERATSRLGMTPDKYRRGAIAASIRYTITESPLGKMLLAATDKGVCSITFAASEEDLELGLKREFPFAQRHREDATLSPWTSSILTRMQGRAGNALPLDIQATAFQKKVWDYLATIPAGQTRSYEEVAQQIGAPAATRAVARACASNPVAVAIPCHRVVRKDGALGGYRWGLDRKQTLLEQEKRSAKP